MASESGRGQTVELRFNGVVDCKLALLEVSRMSGWKAESKERKSRVCEAEDSLTAPEYNETREISLEAGGTTLQA